MPNQLQQTRYDQLIRRAGGIIGPGSKVAEALAELFPMIDVERVPGELLLLGGTHICFGSEQSTGGGADFGTIQLFNPVDSGQLLSISSVNLNVSGGATIRWNIEIVALTNLSTNSAFRDGRLTAALRPVGQIRTVLTAAATTRMGQVRLNAGEPFMLEDINTVAVLAPGTGLTFQSTQFATTLNAAFNWRERVALESELNL